MQRRANLTAAVLAVLIAWTAPCTAQQRHPDGGEALSETPAENGPLSVIEGSVVDDDGRPLADVRVTAVLDPSETQPVARTDAEGRFQLELPLWSVEGLVLRAADEAGRRLAVHQVDYPPGGDVTRAEVELVLQPVREIEVGVVDPAEAPIADAHVGATFAGHPIAEAKTDATGRAALLVPQDAVLEAVWAAKPGVGLDYFAFAVGEDEEEAEEHEQEGAAELLPQDLDRPVTLVLGGVRELTVKAFDADTREPLAGSRVTPWFVYKPEKGIPLTVRGIKLFTRHTDERGIAAIDLLPVDHEGRTLLIVLMPRYVVYEQVVVPPGPQVIEAQAPMLRTVKVSGRVVAVDGSPIAGAMVLAAGDGYQYGYFRNAARTTADGAFEMEVSPEQYYAVVAQRGKDASADANFVVRKGEPVTGLELALRPGRRIHGRLTFGPDGLPLAGARLELILRPTREYATLPVEQQLPNPTQSRDYIQPVLKRIVRTNDDGRYEFFVAPGRYYLVGPTSAPVPRFTITEEESVEIDLRAVDRE